jgi:hypothetical protein
MLEYYLGRAQALQNTEAIEDLTTRLNDVRIAIIEESRTRMELVAAYRTTSTEIISGRAERATGLIGAAMGIVEKLGEITGAGSGATRGFLENIAEELARAGRDIVENVRGGATEFDAAGNSVLNQLVAAFATGPESFATRLSELGPTIAALEATMGEAQRNSFQALIQSMLDNTTAVVDNTEQLNKVTQPNAQSFSSSFWTAFRTAIFNGTGGLLPQYQSMIPSMNGMAPNAGAFSLSVPNRSGGGDEYYHLDVTTPTQVLDPQDVGRQLGFFRKVSGK